MAIGSAAFHLSRCWRGPSGCVAVSRLTWSRLPSCLEALREAAHQIEVHIGGTRATTDGGFEPVAVTE